MRLRALQTDPDAFGATYDSSVLKPDTFWQNRLSEAAAARDQWLLFAKVGASLVGMIGAMREGSSATVISTYVAPEHRGLGIGRALLDALLAELASASVVTATLQVRPSQRAAVALYERAGFRVVGEAPAASDEDLTMKLDLGTPE